MTMFQFRYVISQKGTFKINSKDRTNIRNRGVGGRDIIDENLKAKQESKDLIFVRVHDMCMTYMHTDGTCNKVGNQNIESL